MTLTIGMAHYDDYDGVLLTLQPLAMYRGFEGIEVLIVDNSPHTAEGEAVKRYVEDFAGAGYPVRYVPMREPCGTCPPRQRVFDEARGDAVCCIDCHVLFAPSVITRLVNWFDDHPDSRDILHGPVVRTPYSPQMWSHDVSLQTHFQDIWRAGMHGVWGYDFRGQDPDGDPFEIQASGLGLFACRREAFPGFSPHFRGFGGGEWYVHEKCRRSGGRVLCAPWLRWWHRFGYVGRPPYWCDQIHQMRNYILGHLELGWDLEPIRHHVVDQCGIEQRWWNHIVEDPINHEYVPLTTVEAGTLSIEDLAAMA